MRNLLLVLVSLLVVSPPAAAQIIIEGVNDSPPEGTMAARNYKAMKNTSCRSKDVELTNVHIKEGVLGGDDCDIVLRDCLIDGSVIAKGGDITLERCIVNHDSYVLWVDGKGSITAIDSEVNAKGVSILIHRHGTGNVNLIRTKVRGGRTDVRGKGRIVRGDSAPKGIIIPKRTTEQIPRKGFTYQPEDLRCTGPGTQTYKNLHFDKDAVLWGGDDCDIVIDGCIMNASRVAVTAMGGDVTLRNCEIRGGAVGVQAAGAGTITLIDSTVSSPKTALRIFPGSTGDIVLERTKILKGRIAREGTGKVVR